VCDFGISKLTGAEMDLTRTGQMMGSPLYMSPEAIGSG
jgi:serine/threonine protein kinase